MRWMGVVSVLGVCSALVACGGSGGNGGTGGSGGNGGTGGGSSSSSSGSASSSSGSASSSSGSASSSSGSASSSSGGASALCTNPPANTAPQISDMYSTAPMPAMGTATGGTIESGTYFMTAITNFESTDSGGTHKDTLVIDTAASTFVVDEVNGGTQKPTIAGGLTASGHTLTEALVCPAMVTATAEYTYLAGVLTIYEYTSKSVSVWTKQ